MTSITITGTAAFTFDLDALAQAVAAKLATPVVPPVVPPGAPPPIPTGTAPKLLVVCAQNGLVNPAWNQDYSYDATDARGDKVDGGNGNQSCIKVTTTGPWGGFQPSNDNGKSTDFSACKTLTVDVSAPKGTSYSMQFLRGGDVGINSAGFQFTKTKDGWETFSCPKAQLMTDTALGDVSHSIYKGAIQSKQSTGGDVFLVDNWGGI